MYRFATALLVMVSASTLAVAETPGGDAADLSSLRRALARAAAPQEQEGATRALLAALDRAGQAQSGEAAWLVDRLLVAHPDDRPLLWRRADARDRAGEAVGAVQDLERIVALGGRGEPDALTVRARRALPELYIRTGKLTQAAAADEALLKDKLVDPSPVLTRLVRTYQSLGRNDRAAALLKQTQIVSADQQRKDPDLSWVQAESAERDGDVTRAAQLYRAFVADFPTDPRREEALTKSAEMLEKAGQRGVALSMTDQAIEKSKDAVTKASSRLTRAEILQRDGRLDEAAREYNGILSEASDLMQVAVALHGLVETEKRRGGPLAALLALGEQMRRTDRFTGPLARRHFQTLLGEVLPSVAGHPDQVLLVTAVANDLHVEALVPPSLWLAAARVRETVGDDAQAAEGYARLIKEPGPIGEEARRGLTRCRPQPAPDGIAPDDAERLAALERREDWDALLDTLTDPQLDGRNGVVKRTLAARAAFARKDVPRAAQALEPLDHVTGEAALLRGDARWVAGNAIAACQDYRNVAPSYARGVEHEWLETRLAACEDREGRHAAARTRLEALLAEKPGEPAATAAQGLLQRISATPQAAIDDEADDVPAEEVDGEAPPS